jgi:hypothetical protein
MSDTKPLAPIVRELHVVAREFIQCFLCTEFRMNFPNCFPFYLPSYSVITHATLQYFSLEMTVHYMCIIISLNIYNKYKQVFQFAFKEALELSCNMF